MHARPPHDLTIEVGPVGGSYYENAQRYRDILATHGIDLHIVPTQNSLDILKDVATPGSGIDVGFMAQDVRTFDDADVSVIGLVQLQPLFIFASADLGRHSVLDDMRGRRIVLLPPNSATTAAALRVFELYDITPENTSFSYLPLAEAVQELRAGRFDAGVFMLAPENKVIRELAADSGLHLVPMTEAHAITHHLPFLQPVGGGQANNPATHNDHVMSHGMAIGVIRGRLAGRCSGARRTSGSRTTGFRYPCRSG